VNDLNLDVQICIFSFSCDDVPHVGVPLGNRWREELLDHLQPNVLCFREYEVNNGREDEKDCPEHEKGAENVHVRFQRWVEFEGEDKENARDRSSQTLAGGSDIRWEEFTRENKGQGLHSKLYREDEETDCNETPPLEHGLQSGAALFGEAVHQVGEGGEGDETEEGEREADEVHASSGYTSQQPCKGEAGDEPAHPDNHCGHIRH